MLKEWTGSVWLVIGPVSILPTTQYVQYALSRTTSNGSTTELFVNGVTNLRQLLNDNTTYAFEVVISARRTDAGVEFGGWKITGVINNTANTLIFSGTPSIVVIGNTSPWTVSVTADTPNGSLDVFVTGQAGKTINWSAVSTLYITA